MGGSVGVTIRLPDSVEHRMCRWTNVLPWALTNLRFIQEDPAHLAEYLEQWLSMKADWEENRATGKFRHNMTDVYAPYARLAPCEYGLVVVDMVNKVIVHSQEYTSIGTISPATMAGEDPDDDDSTFNRLKALMEAGRASTFLGYKRSAPRHPVPSPWPTAEAVLENLEEGDRSCLDGAFVIDMSPYKVERFPRNPEGMMALRQRVLDLGFVLTEEEEAEWRDWVRTEET